MGRCVDLELRLYPWSEGCRFKSHGGQSDVTVGPLSKGFKRQLPQGLADLALSIVCCFGQNANKKNFKYHLLRPRQGD